MRRFATAARSQFRARRRQDDLTKSAGCRSPRRDAFFRDLNFRRASVRSPSRSLDEILQRLDFLQNVGVDYLTLDRPADTLSGGELQRVRLATGIGSGLVGVCYVLDEPSIGLHPRDNQRLIEALRDLQQQGNTVLVVEHDEAMMREADWLIDVGPGAGVRGGRIVAQGTAGEVCRIRESITGGTCSGELQIRRAGDAPPTSQDRARWRSKASRPTTCRTSTSQFPLGPSSASPA